MGTLVLFSGGMDSTIALFWALNEASTPVHGLTFDYAQKHRREVGQASKIWRLVRRSPHTDKLGELHIEPLVLPRSGSLMTGAPVTRYAERPSLAQAYADPAFVPYRNLIFLSLAASWARHLDCATIVTGLRGGWPDCTQEFEEEFCGLANLAVPEHHLWVTSPVHDSRAECVRLAQQLPGCMEALALTHTCFVGEDKPCGECLPCRKRAEGFAEVGIADPIFSGVS